MQEIFKYLYDHSSNKDKCIIRPLLNELCFYYIDFCVIFEYLEVKNLDIYKECVSLSSIDLQIFKFEHIKKVSIKSSSIIHCNEEKKKNYTSYSNMMYNFLKWIKTSYSDAIAQYRISYFHTENKLLKLVYPYDYEYGFQIDITTKYWINYSFYKFLISETNIKNSDHLIPPFYDITKRIKESFDIQILNTSTKIRRLGYFKILLKFFQKQNKMPIAKFNIKFEKYCQNFNIYLKGYKNQKGNIIETKTGNSANPYIEMALTLGFINKSAGIYEIGKNGRAYIILKDKIDKIDTNPFVMSVFDTTFFLEILLKEDYWFIYTILEQATINSTSSYKDLKKEFKSILLEQIIEFINIVKEFDSSSKLLPIKVIQRRINEWKKPEVYMEHVLMPRLNWLYDMELIEIENDLSFHLTLKGAKIFNNLSIWNDIASHKVISPICYIENYFMKVINDVFDLNVPTKTLIMNDEIKNNLNESFFLFKTLAPNRVTFSLSANYTKHMLFWKNIGIIDTEDFKNIFESKKMPNFIYKYQEHYKDGYIQKK